MSEKLAMPKMTSLPAPTMNAEVATVLESSIFRAVIQKRVDTLKAEREQFIPQRQTELNNLQQQISDLQSRLQTLLKEGDGIVAGYNAAIGELETLLL